MWYQIRTTGALGGGALTRSLDIAQHEAAHVVVGVSLGLRLRKAVIATAHDYHGFAWFTLHGSRMSHALMYAAGVAWDHAVQDHSPCDAALCRELVKTDADVRTCVRVASFILSSRCVVHNRVTRALLERDLNARDIAAIARGENLPDPY